MHLEIEDAMDFQSFFAGARMGVWLYAWSKDGIQYVGTAGRTLKEATAEIDQQEKKYILAEEILKFLAAHGKRNAEEPDEWSSPDALAMEMTARELKKGNVRVPNSSWSSGGYGPYLCKEGKAWHDALWKSITELG